MIKNFFYRLKNFNKSNILFFLIFVLSFILSFLIFITLIGNIPNLEEVKNVSKLIQKNYILFNDENFIKKIFISDISNFSFLTIIIFNNCNR